MSDEYPNPCSRCGYCCLAEVCPIGLHVHQIAVEDKRQRCPSLELVGTVATCLVAQQRPELMETLGIGKGCCIKATVMGGGRQWDFAALPPEYKSGLVKMAVQNTIPLYYRKKVTA